MRLFAHLFIILLSFVSLRAQTDPLARASSLEEEGKFREAAETLRSGLTTAKGHDLKKSIEFELDRLERIRRDFPYTKDRLFEILTIAVRDLTREEFEQWIAEGRFDSRTIDGAEFYMGSSRSNLFFRYPELATRRINPPDDTQFEQSVWTAVTSIQEAAGKSGSPYVLPNRFTTRMSVTAKANAAPPGETIRAWIPVPRTYPFQKDFALVSTSSPVVDLAPETSPIRSVALEQKAEAEKPTVFSIEYLYTAYGIWFDPKPEKVEEYDPEDEAVKLYTGERPHVEFSPAVRDLARQLAGNEPNPVIRAKRFYDWITENIQYSYAIEYSTIRNITEYCITKMYGDCGQTALLFISLCRSTGIPARWQSAWLTIPGGKTIHDWTEIYIPPYGWIPVDPYMGVFAMQYFDSVSPEQRRRVRDFYFGGLDQYRMAANSDHSQTLSPPKRSLRSDTVDFQRGELEYGSTNLYFDKYSYKLEIEEVPLTP